MGRDGHRKGPFEAALEALNRREHSTAELSAWLEGRGYEPEEVDAAVAALAEAGTVDDERYARLFSEEKRELHGWGPERIAAALAERGIDGTLIDRYAGSEGHGEQVGRAVELLRERGAPLGDDRERNRALGLLTRRGYSYEVAHDAIRALEGADERV